MNGLVIGCSVAAVYAIAWCIIGGARYAILKKRGAAVADMDGFLFGLLWPFACLALLGHAIGDRIASGASVGKGAHDAVVAERDALAAELQALKTAKAERGGLR